ncbi:uncharacterized protein LOC135394357 [Ornithodoros turicata]|uniref:uncharacterized protein LOC135394357 n=1 Tax=Ornithodoros turicata TaxID=34597 RepID=UPI003139064A
MQQPLGLSLRDFKSRVARFAEERGIINKLRANLRCEFVKALELLPHRAQDFSSRTLSHQVIQSLIAEYLSHHGFHYTVSTLVCESAHQTCLTATDVRALLHLGKSQLPALESIVHERMGTVEETEALHQQLENTRRQLQEICEKMTPVESSKLCEEHNFSFIVSTDSAK